MAQPRPRLLSLSLSLSPCARRKWPAMPMPSSEVSAGASGGGGGWCGLRAGRCCRGRPSVLVVIAARALGLAPYRRLRSGEYSRWPALQLLSYLALGALCAGALYALVEHTLAIVNTDTGAKFQAMLLSNCLTTLAISVFLVAMWTRQYPCVLEVLNSDAFQLHGRGPASWLLPALMPATELLGTALFVVLSAKLDRNVLDTRGAVCFVGVYVVRHGNLLLLAYLLECLVAQLECGNSALRGLLSRGGGQGGGLGSELVMSVRLRHKEVGVLAQALSHCFGPELITRFLLDFWWIVRETFEIIISKDNLMARAGITVNVLSVLFKNCLLIYIADRLKCKGGDTQDLIHQLQNSSPVGGHQWDELKAFSQQISQRPCTLRPCGIVEFNLTSLFQAAQMAVSYLVVLTQFHQSEA